LYERYIIMTRLNVSKAREEFPEVVNRAALLERLAREERDRLDLEDARAALKEAEEKGTTPLRNLIRELGD
jgi:hypothetical protein